MPPDEHLSRLPRPAPNPAAVSSAPTEKMQADMVTAPIRLRRRLLQHHLPLLLTSTAGTIVLYATRPGADLLNKVSFATAYVSLMLLVITLLIGPWRILRGSRVPISQDLRRDVGIWAGITGALHAGVGQCVHLRGRPWLYYVYESRSLHAMPIRHDLFGFANYTGALGTLLLLILLATSNDFFLRKLGTPQWKQLQRWNYAVFALVILHAAAYQFTEKQALPFVLVIVISGTLTVALQALGYHRRRARATPRV